MSKQFIRDSLHKGSYTYDWFSRSAKNTKDFFVFFAIGIPNENEQIRILRTKLIFQIQTYDFQFDFEF